MKKYFLLLSAFTWFALIVLTGYTLLFSRSTPSPPKANQKHDLSSQKAKLYLTDFESINAAHCVEKASLQKEIAEYYRHLTRFGFRCYPAIGDILTGQITISEKKPKYWFLCQNSRKMEIVGGVETDCGH